MRLTHALASLGLLAAAIAGSAQTPWHGGYFPNVELTTQSGERVGFYDLIKGKTVAIELIYTSCRFACPLETARLAQVQKLLGDRMGKDVFFYSISIDPAHDTPAVLKAFADQYHAGPGWTFLTGRAADIEALSRKLGLYTPPDPEAKDGHTPALLIGNEPSGQWMRASALDNPAMTATMITRWVAGYPPAAAVKSYADAGPVPKMTGGEYVFRSKCRACHAQGTTAGLGPDLRDVTRRRARPWLERYISDPDGMVRAGDPDARALAAGARTVRMPNLQLSEQQVRDVIDYLETLGSRLRH